MKYLALALLLNCPITKKIGTDWNETDNKIVERAKIRCPILYPNSPCVKTVIKKSPLNYHIVCGKPNETN